MCRNYAAREDTVVFPAWKAAIPEDELAETAEQFEDIEHAEFGEDGFDDAAHRIASIERGLGFSDLARFTAPPPP
jgi:hemerythrin superfamily protein